MDDGITWKLILVGALIGVGVAYWRTKQQSTMTANAPIQRNYNGGQGFGG
jgi:hypothetical protein